MTSEKVNMDFLQSVVDVLERARKNVKAAIDLSMFYPDDQIGQTISDQLIK